MEQICRFHRVLLKLSGEALKGSRTDGYEPEAVKQIVERIRSIRDCGVQVAVVIGAGNLWRGAAGAGAGMDRVTADGMGMLATVMNALCVKDFLRAAGIPALVQTAVPMEPIARRYDRDAAVAALEAGTVVLFAGGTGSPFFTTDTTSALRALETDCDAMLKATKVDGIYSADPMKDPAAVRYDRLSFDEAISRNLRVLDQTAFSMCRDNHLPIIVFNFNDPESFRRVLAGDTGAGTIVSDN